MLIQKIKTYKWQALASLLMTGLMVASSLLQPRYLQEVLDLSLIHISEPTRRLRGSRMPSSA